MLRESAVLCVCVTKLTNFLPVRLVHLDWILQLCTGTGGEAFEKPSIYHLYVTNFLPV